MALVIFALNGCSDKSKIEDLAEDEFSKMEQRVNQIYPDKHIEIYEKYGQMIAVVTYFDKDIGQQYAAYYYQKYNGDFTLVRWRYGHMSFLNREGL